ncbi:hypothetical protein [Novosphingobium album (ex Liu et al. 2023)]|uniref:Uncharacterized protein n=1 Tax=Novosphingobium album (ex Liu et al. 2023) TaxID=3031130 RepID=A0ABT5WRX6_9SPHN|nr:hypothetical protein [Novosphingobium album (ex Liu et al. 2023)]MDE8652780.1 hypothetical protein [Novosphingobium album (ex Liu et al. 2023)]
MTTQEPGSASWPSGKPELIDELITQAGQRAKELLSAPDAAAALRQIGPDRLSDIQRLELSPSAVDQFVAVALRLAGSRTARGDACDHLVAYFRTPASSLEIEAERRTIWQANRDGAALAQDAGIAAAKIERALSGHADADLAMELSRWAALYADLWCDPRLGASGEARRVMLEMVSLLHERSRALAAVLPERDGIAS